MSRYSRVINGSLFAFNPGKVRDSEFSEASNMDAVSDAWMPMLFWDVPQGQAVAFGRGDSYNPDKAEGFVHIDIQNASAAAVDGEVRLAIYNSAGERVDTIYRNDTDTLRQGSAADATVPFPYQAIRGGAGEVGYPYTIALEVRTDTGTETVSLSDSAIGVDGYKGNRKN